MNQLARAGLLIMLWLGVGFAGAGVMSRAAPYLPILGGEVREHWPSAPQPHIMAAQIEQESGWDNRATLKTSRELGRGLAQITVTPRFNAYLDSAKHGALKNWAWEKDPYNVTYQITFLILRDKANFAAVRKYFIDDESRWAGALVAYNAGLGTVNQRRAAAKAAGINSNIWFGGLDRARMQYESKKLYGRDLGAMRNEYPRLIIKVRAPKYRGLIP